MTAADLTHLVGPALASALAAKGYDTLTPVQEAVLDEAIDGRDLRITSQTGSGKSLAIGFAVRDLLDDLTTQYGDAARPRVLVLVVQGIGLSCIPRHKLADATGSNSLLRQIGGSVGLAAFATLLSRAQDTARAGLVAHVVAGSTRPGYVSVPSGIVAESEKWSTPGKRAGGAYQAAAREELR